MARKRAGSIDSDDSTNARAERRAKRTQFLGTRLRGRTDSCYILASALKNASNPDEKYWLSAAVDLAILAARTRRCTRHRRDTHRRTTQAIIFFFIWAEKSLRRARKQRRSESADDDVESGARSPQ